MPTPQELLEALKQVKYPGFTRDIVAFGMINTVVYNVLQPKWAGDSLNLSPLVVLLAIYLIKDFVVPVLYRIASEIG